MARKKKEPETKEPEQKEPEWQTGLPERPGLYDCLVDGQRTTLQFKRCIFSGRRYWIHIDGSDIPPNAEVKWHDGKVLLG